MTTNIKHSVTQMRKVLISHVLDQFAVQRKNDV